MNEDTAFRLIVFFVANTIAMTGAHIGLVRLIGQAGKSPQLAIKDERLGILIAVKCAVINLILAPLPLAIELTSPKTEDNFYIPSILIPLTILLLTSLNVWACRKKDQKFPDKYYFFFFVIIISLCLLLIYLTCCEKLPSITVFIYGLCMPLGIIILQLVKSTLRFCDIKNKNDA